MMDTPGTNPEAFAAAQSQERIDADNLNTLTLCHYIMGGLTALFSCLFIMHIVMGAMMIHHPSAFMPPVPVYPAPPPSHPYPSSPPYSSSPTYPAGASYPFFPPFMGYMFLTMGIIAVALGWTLGGLTAYAGHCLRARKNYIFILIVAGLNCAFVMPLGTILGAFTFVVLLRPTVKALFQQP